MSLEKDFNSAIRDIKLPAEDRRLSCVCKKASAFKVLEATNSGTVPISSMKEYEPEKFAFKANNWPTFSIAWEMAS